MGIPMYFCGSMKVTGSGQSEITLVSNLGLTSYYWLVYLGYLLCSPEPWFVFCTMGGMLG